jgi:hypothetical protein
MAVMRLVSLGAALAAFVAGAPAMAQCLAPEAVAKLEGVHPFVQTRTLTGVARPLVSSGEVEAKGDAVIWRVTKPVEIVTTIGPTGVTQAIDGGPAESVSGGGNNPFFSETGLLDLLKGDLSGVEARYGVTRGVRKAPAGWTLDLKPKSEALAPYIASISVAGCMRVEAVAVTQANGDVIRVDLKDAP